MGDNDIPNNATSHLWFSAMFETAHFVTSWLAIETDTFRRCKHSSFGYIYTFRDQNVLHKSWALELFLLKLLFRESGGTVMMLPNLWVVMSNYVNVASFPEFFESCNRSKFTATSKQLVLFIVNGFRNVAPKWLFYLIYKTLSSLFEYKQS